MHDILADSTVGFGLFTVANSFLFYGVHLVVRRFFSDAPAATRWAATGIMAVVFVLILTQACSAAAVYNRYAVTLGCVLFAGITHWLWRARLDFRTEAEAVKAWFRGVIRSRGALLLCATMVTLLLALVRSLSRPPLGWDSLTYHLFFAARYVQLHWLAGFKGPYAMDHYAHFPINGEIMAAWLLLPFKSDLFVGLLNFPFLGLGAIAVYRLCRELGVKWDVASLAACLVCFSPFLFAYLTTQDVDIQAFAALMCGSLFVVCYLRDKRDRNAWLGFASVGIAIGTKYSALPLAALLLCTLAIGVVQHYGEKKAFAQPAAIMVCGLALVVLLGGRQYVKNWLETGNPVYPLEVVVAGHEILPGSSYTRLMSEEKGKGARTDDLFQLAQTFNYFPTWRNPTTAGPKFLLLFALALGALAPFGGKEHNWPVWLLVAYGVAGVAMFYLPSDGFAAFARRHWIGASARFLAPSFALLTVAAMPLVTSLQSRWPLLMGVLVSFVLWDMMVASTNVSANFPLAVGLGVAVLVPGIMAVSWAHWLPRITPGHAITSLLLVGWLAVCLLQMARDQSRWHHYSNSTDVVEIPRDFVDGWRYCDRPEQPLRIALTAGWDYLGQNWFFYPLLGRRLQNSVTYVPAVDHEEPDRKSFSNGDKFPAWLKNLQDVKVNTIFVQKPWPVEENWIEAHPEKFALLKEGAAFKIYRLL